MIGILALQGAFLEHKSILEKIGIESILIKKHNQIKHCDGIIIPGGESTAMGIIEENLFNEIQIHIKKKKVIWGTCAGLVLLSDNILYQDLKLIGGLKVTAQRNYFGSQQDSFVISTKFPEQFKKDGHFQAIFIRAPVIIDIEPKVDVLLKINNNIVAVQQDNILATSFHPELSNDFTWHEYFIRMVNNNLKKYDYNTK